jgi:streptomycin 6-kinase
MIPQGLLDHWQLTRPERIADTPTSTVWKVARSDGSPAVLKLLHPGEIEELRGADYLHALDGKGAVRVIARHDGAILMEWCDGPSLGDLVRSGQDAQATEIVCDTILALHAAPVDAARLQPLAARFAPLLSASTTGDLAAATALARTLLDTTGQATALHGDLHHDNILHSHRGWLAIDPKGVWGDPAYETANAFRNPDGAGDLVFRPDRIAALADCFAHRLGHPRERLLGWAAAHSALTTFWSREAGRDTADDFRLLPLLLASAAAPD